MKYIVLLALLVIAANSLASITLTSQYGVAFNQSGEVVPDGTLWALVVDSDTNNEFGGFGLDESLYSQNLLNPGVADTFFTPNQPLSLGGSFGGGTVFAIGEFDSLASGEAGIYADIIVVESNVNGVLASRNFAFYWFPGATLVGAVTDPQMIANQVGGIHTSSTDGLFDTGMIMPSDGASVSVGAATSGAGGTIADVDFRAVTLIPEPGTALLAALGSLILLRRRREVVA